MTCLATMGPFGKLLFSLWWVVIFVGPIAVAACVVWLVHTIWSYRHIPPK